MSVNRKLGVAKFEPEITIENKLDEIKADHMKKIYYPDLNILSIKSNNNSSSYEYPTTMRNICTTYKTLKETFHLVKNKTIHPSKSPK